jgi:hypothetical protein
MEHQTRNKDQKAEPVHAPPALRIALTEAAKNQKVARSGSMIRSIAKSIRVHRVDFAVAMSPY